MYNLCNTFNVKNNTQYLSNSKLLLFKSICLFRTRLSPKQDIFDMSGGKCKGPCTAPKQVLTSLERTHSDSFWTFGVSTVQLRRYHKRIYLKFLKNFSRFYYCSHQLLYKFEHHEPFHCNKLLAARCQVGCQTTASSSLTTASSNLTTASSNLTATCSNLAAASSYLATDIGNLTASSSNLAATSSNLKAASFNLTAASYQHKSDATKNAVIES